jgi:hypothetical protein
VLLGHGFDPGSGQTKGCKIGICCFSAKYVVRANTGWLGIGDNAPEWSDMSTCGLVVSMS